jgi:FtsH-binding integral membrane protein
VEQVSVSGYAERATSARTPTLFGRVMGLVALTVGVATLGVWVARDWGGAGWFIAWLLALGCLIGLNVASSRGNTGLAFAPLFGFGLLIGASLGSVGYAIRRYLSFLYRLAFWLLLGLIIAGIVLIFVRIPAAYTAYSLAGLAIFGLYVVIDFNRLRRAGADEAIPLAAGIFLDVLNIFLLFLRLFGRSS